MPAITLKARDEAGPPLALAAVARRAEAMIPALRDRADAAEKLRRLPDETMAELRASGIARVLQPASFGGAEAPLSGMLDVLIPIGAGCGSTAWCLAQYIMHNYMIARWPLAAQQHIWGAAPDCLVSGIVIPLLGTAKSVPGGYVIDGNWPFVSGVIGSDWCVLAAMAEDGTEIYVIVPTASLEIVDTWHSVGLCGSGSHNVVARALFVPEIMSVQLTVLRDGPAPGAAPHPAPLYRCSVGMTFGILLSSAILGMAEHMFEDYLAQSRSRVALMSGASVASYGTHHMKVGEVSASLQAAEALLRADCAEILEAVGENRPLGDIERTGYRCNAAFAGRLAHKAARTVWDLVGARGVYAGTPLARAFQDISVATRHFTQNWDVNATEHGRARFRLPLTNSSV